MKIEIKKEIKKICLGMLTFFVCLILLGCNKNNSEITEESKKLFEDFANSQVEAKLNNNFQITDDFAINEKIEGTLIEIINEAFEEDESVDKNTLYNTYKFEDGFDYGLFKTTSTRDENFVMLIKNNNGKLEIVFEDYYWSRKNIDFYTNGIINTYGSNGAASHIENYFFVDSDGKLNVLYKQDSEGLYMFDIEGKEEFNNIPEEEKINTTLNFYLLGNGEKSTIITVLDENGEFKEASEELKTAILNSNIDLQGEIISIEEINEKINNYANENNISFKNLQDKYIDVINNVER